MIRYYHSTHLEDWVYNFYEYLGIKEPHQLNLIDIASKLNVWVHFLDRPSRAVERENGLWTIIIDRRISPAEQWQDFGHELCHLLFHAGNQLHLPDSLICFQERKANNFALEFCVPSFMLFKQNLPLLMRDAVQFVSETFNVTPAFAEKRLIQIEQRFLAGQAYAQFSAICATKDKDLLQIF